MSEAKKTPPWGLELAVGVAVLLAVGVNAASLALSYDAIEAVGLAANIDPARVWLLPVSVDGTMTVSALAAALLGFLTRRTPWYPMCVFVLGAAISMWCNGMHALTVGHLEAGLRVAVSAIPGLMSIVAPHLLLEIGRHAWQAFTQARRAQEPAPEEVAPVSAPPAAAPQGRAVMPAEPAPGVEPVEVEPVEPVEPVAAPARPRLELVPRPPRPAAPAAEDGEDPQAVALDLFGQGMAPAVIAQRIGKSTRQVQRYLRKAQEPAESTA